MSEIGCYNAHVPGKPRGDRSCEGVTTRKCQNCPVRENANWKILGVEREFAPIERPEDTAESIWSSLQGEKRPLNCLISLPKQSFSVDCDLRRLWAP
jgi:hypothetical protein